MTHSTLERPSFIPEAQNASRLDLNHIKVVQQLPEWSPYELRTLAPTPDRPVAVYLATPKEEDEDTMRGSLIAIKESDSTSDSMEVFWQTDPDSMSVVRARAGREVEQMGVGDDPSVAGTFDMKQGDKLFFITNQRLDALKKSGQFTTDGIDLILENENERQEIIEITLDGAATVDDTAVAVGVTNVETPIDSGAPSVKQQFIEHRKARKAKHDRDQAKAAKAPSQTDDGTSTAVPPIVTPLIFAQSRRAPISTADTVARPSSVSSQEHQHEIDTERGFTVINKRARSRDELLNTPLEDLIASVDADRAAKNATANPSSPDQQPDDTSAADQETVNQPSDNIIAVTRYYKVPPKPDYDPTIQDMFDAKDKFSLKSLLGDVYARFSAANFIRKNNRQPRNPDKEKRLKRIGAVAAMGAVGFVLYQMNPEWQSSFGDAFNNIVPGATDAIDESVSEVMNTGDGQNQDSMANLGAEDDHQPDEAVVPSERLDSSSHIIPAGGGGEAYALANGANPSVWYQNQAEFLQLFPNEAHLMLDGNVGFNRPGELSDAAKEYWTRKFGQ